MLQQTTTMTTQVDDTLKIKSAIERELELLDVEFLSMNEAYSNRWITGDEAKLQAAKLNKRKAILEGRLMFIEEMAR